MKALHFTLITILASLLISCNSNKILVQNQSVAKEDTTALPKPILEYLTLDLSYPLQVTTTTNNLDLANILPYYKSQLSESLKYTQPSFNTHPFDIIGKAFEFQGVRYRRGGTSLMGMDCSGLVFTCYSAYGVTLPRSSAAMANVVPEVPRSDARKGDLIFFKTNRKHSRINHVGMIVEISDKEIKFIHASIKKGVIVSSTNEAYYSRTYAKIGRIKDLL